MARRKLWGIRPSSEAGFHWRLDPLPLLHRSGRIEADGADGDAHSAHTYKTYKEKLRPTPAQERALEEVLWRCRELYNAALEQRITAWQRRHVSVSRYEQEAELKAIRAEFPEYAAIHCHVLQDVLARLDKTYQAFFRRVQRGEKAGFPRFKGRNRFHSFTFKEYGNGARLDNGFLVLSKIGRISVHWSRPIEGTPKTVTISKEADGWYVAISCAEVPVHPLPSTGTGDGDRPGAGVLRHARQWAAASSPPLLSQGGSLSAPLPATGRTAQEGQPPQAQSGRAAGQSAPAHCAASDATSTTSKPASWCKRTT